MSRIENCVYISYLSWRVSMLSIDIPTERGFNNHPMSHSLVNKLETRWFSSIVTNGHCYCGWRIASYNNCHTR